LSSVFTRLIIREIVKRIVRDLTNKMINEYGESVSRKLTEGKVRDAIPPRIYSQLRENAERVGGGYVILPFGLILTILSLWATSLGSFFTIFGIIVLLIGIGVIYGCIRAIITGKKALKNLEEDILTYLEQEKLEIF
jgi:hypothetical protein